MSRIDKAIELATQKKHEKSAPKGYVPTDKPEAAEHRLSEAGFDRIRQLPVSNPFLVAATEPSCFAAEQYKKLRSLIIRRHCQDASCNSLLITSAIPGEGKSLTALNLAITLAKTADYSVILVDADLRNPQLHQMLGLEPRIGLTHYLRDDVRIETVMHKVGLGNLTLIPAGERVVDPLELLTAKKMAQLVTELKERYPDRFVVLDTPPVLPFADVRVLGEMVDQVLFVCREGVTPLNQIQDGVDALSEYELMGIVCNDISMMMQAEYSSYYGIK